MAGSEGLAGTTLKVCDCAFVAPSRARDSSLFSSVRSNASRVIDLIEEENSSRQNFPCQTNPLSGDNDNDPLCAHVSQTHANNSHDNVWLLLSQVVAALTQTSWTQSEFRSRQIEMTLCESKELMDSSVSQPVSRRDRMINISPLSYAARALA